MIILDTNVLSELMRPRPDDKVKNWLLGLGAAPLVTTAICVAEIAFGLSRLEQGSRRRMLEAKFETFVGPESGLVVLAFDDVMARKAGVMRARREAAGLSAAPSDMMIAGIVATAGASFATRNTRDFSDLNLELINPWDA